MMPQILPGYLEKETLTREEYVELFATKKRLETERNIILHKISVVDRILHKHTDVYIVPISMIQK